MFHQSGRQRRRRLIQVKIWRRAIRRPWLGDEVAAAQWRACPAGAGLAMWWRAGGTVARWRACRIGAPSFKCWHPLRNGFGRLVATEQLEHIWGSFIDIVPEWPGDVELLGINLTRRAR